ncbi:MAG: PAS domain S-box protein [Candidatus Lokiarchaeota archaeon]|nr:PAS domain S-box protein [Candidatus Lokiarchaeota archaeon]
MKKKTLKESEILRVVHEQSIMGIYIIQNNKIVYANKGAEEIHGYPFEETQHWTLKEILMPIHPDDREFVLEQLKKKQEGSLGAVTNYQYRFRTKSGELKWVEIYSKSILFENKPADMITTIDVTKEKLYKERLIESEGKFKDAYKRVNFLNDLFAHDMSNILQNIKLSAEYFDLIQHDPKKVEEFGNLFNIIKEHVNRGKSLIINVRKLSKLDEEALELNPINVLEFLNKSINNVKSGFKDRNIKIQVNGLDETDKVRGNELLIDVFDNLLNNAVKYTHNEQDVTMIITASKHQEEDKQVLRLEFKDFGIGIPDEKKETLFTKTYSEDVTDHGMGMGLSLVKRIVDRYGGNIEVRDRVEGDFSKGSNFVLDLLCA